MTNSFQLSSHFAVLSFSLLVYLAWQTEAKEKSIEKMIEDSKNKQIPSLSCHVCHSETDETCFNFTANGEDFEGFPRSCESDHHLCVVKSFKFTSTDGYGATTAQKTFSVKRNCTKRCEEGCVVMGERTRLYVCSKCCSTPNCNVGSGSSSLHQNYIQNSFKLFLPSVSNLHGIVETLFHGWWYALELSYSFSPQLWIKVLLDFLPSVVQKLTRF